MWLSATRAGVTDSASCVVAVYSQYRDYAYRQTVTHSASCVVAVYSQYRDYAYRQLHTVLHVLWLSTASTGIMPIDSS